MTRYSEYQNEAYNPLSILGEIVKLQVRSKGPGQGPVSSPWSRFKSELRNSKFSVKFSKERTWRDTIIKQATPPHHHQTF